MMVGEAKETHWCFLVLRSLNAPKAEVFSQGINVEVFLDGTSTICLQVFEYFCRALMSKQEGFTFSFGAGALIRLWTSAASG